MLIIYYHCQPQDSLSCAGSGHAGVAGVLQCGTSAGIAKRTATACCNGSADCDFLCCIRTTTVSCLYSWREEGQGSSSSHLNIVDCIVVVLRSLCGPLFWACAGLPSMPKLPRSSLPTEAINAPRCADNFSITKTCLVLELCSSSRRKTKSSDWPGAWTITEIFLLWRLPQKPPWPRVAKVALPIRMTVWTVRMCIC